jgi:peptidoglycan-N-acetylglucosamine deacetylase
MHDFQRGTSHAVPQLLAELKAGGYKIVHMKSRTAVTTFTLCSMEPDGPSNATAKIQNLTRAKARPSRMRSGLRTSMTAMGVRPTS